MNKAQQFEQEKQLKPTEAAKLLGVSYSLWKQLKSGAKPIKDYHTASIDAHLALNKTQFEKLKSERIK